MQGGGGGLSTMRSSMIATLRGVVISVVGAVVSEIKLKDPL